MCPVSVQTRGLTKDWASPMGSQYTTVWSGPINKFPFSCLCVHGRRQPNKPAYLKPTCLAARENPHTDYVLDPSLCLIVGDDIINAKPVPFHTCVFYKFLTMFVVGMLFVL